ncbi:MAG TPA: DUF3175 domain-containing protein [Pirellulales bacterium]|jgi:tRNA(adenine34) deaminase|nr:DUF3175 domain-containing protein [Pirellulales bacterium]
MVRRWVKDVKTVSTFPPEHMFDQPAEEIAKTMADPKVSPKGLGSAIRMVQYFINRGGKGLSAKRQRELEKAKKLLQERREKETDGKKKKPPAKKRPAKKKAKKKEKKRASNR